VAERRPRDWRGEGEIEQREQKIGQSFQDCEVAGKVHVGHSLLEIYRSPHIAVERESEREAVLHSDSEVERAQQINRRAQELKVNFVLCSCLRCSALSRSRYVCFPPSALCLHVMRAQNRSELHLVLQALGAKVLEEHMRRTKVASVSATQAQAAEAREEALAEDEERLKEEEQLKKESFPLAFLSSASLLSSLLSQPSLASPETDAAISTPLPTTTCSAEQVSFVDSRHPTTPPEDETTDV
jgi:hypothetical protein